MNGPPVSIASNRVRWPPSQLVCIQKFEELASQFVFMDLKRVLAINKPAVFRRLSRKPIDKSRSTDILLQHFQQLPSRVFGCRIVEVAAPQHAAAQASLFPGEERGNLPIVHLITVGNHPINIGKTQQRRLQPILITNVNEGIVKCPAISDIGILTDRRSRPPSMFMEPLGRDSYMPAENINQSLPRSG